MTLYADCGWNPNDNSLPVAANHVDNGNCIIFLYQQFMINSAYMIYLGLYLTTQLKSLNALQVCNQ